MTLDLPRIRALCFDVDGTLRDTDDQYVEKLTGWLRPVRSLFPRRNPQLFARKLVTRIESPGTYLLQLSHRIRVDNLISRLLNQLYQQKPGHSHDSMPAIPGVIDALWKLHDQYPMAIISSRGEHHTLAFLNQWNLTPLFQVIVSAQTCRHTKPHPEPIRWAAEKIGVQPEACLMVGDTTIDILAGKRAGAQAVGVLCGFGEEAELRRAGADRILSTTTDLIQVLLE